MIRGPPRSTRTDTLFPFTALVRFYDVKSSDWSSDLCDVFSLPMSLLPPLKSSGEVLGNIRADIAQEWGIAADALVVVGGADTQLAVHSTKPERDDVVIVSGTTTPIIKVVDAYITDEQQRTWTGRHIDANRFMLEANAGVTGLNYQRLKEIFYPNEDYEIIEDRKSTSLNSSHK